MAYEIILTQLALDGLNPLRVYDRRRILEEIEKQLIHQPTTRTRNRKPLPEAVPDFEYEPPVWELRVEDFRVFYDVNEAEQAVYVRAVRQKRQGQTTEDIIHEKHDS